MFYACSNIVFANEGKAGVTLERIPFVLPKLGLKLDLFLMEPLQLSIIWKNLSVYQKDQRRCTVFGEARRFFKNCPKKTIFVKHVNYLFFFLIDTTKHVIIVFKSVLSVLIQEFSLALWLHVRRENEPPQKNWLVPIFLGLLDQPKIKFALVRPAPSPSPHPPH